MDQTSLQPTSKMTVVGAVLALEAAVFGLLTALGVQVAQNLPGALTTLIVAVAGLLPFVAGYLKQEKLPMANSKS